VPRANHSAPKHRAAPTLPSRRAGVRRTLTLTGVAVAATGMAVATGIGSERGGSAAASSTASPASAGSPVSLTTADPATPDPVQSTLRSPRRVTPGEIDDRARVPSRSDQRTAVDPVKKAALDQDQGGQATSTEDLTSRDPRTIARAMLPEFGFGSDQFSCLDSIYVNESGWNVHADNPSSSAYGIPQALPGSKMSSAGSDWADNPVTQIRWGLGYIKARYGTPCSAWSFKEGHGWY
jgi:hypothetical protein